MDSEGKLYDEAKGSECDYVGRIELCEDVLVSDQKDTTNTLIRQDLDPSTSLGKRSTDQRAESTEPYIHVTCTDIGDIKEVFLRESGPPVPRVRTRVVLSTYGWLIKYFSTPRELLVVLQDAIRGRYKSLRLNWGLIIFIGHQCLYKKGVLHRDISPGNILIKWQPGIEADQPSTSGCLIDLDHAKKGKPSSKQVTARSVDDDLDDLVRLWCSKKRVEMDVARLSLEFFPMNQNNALPALTYLNAALERALTFRPLNQQPCTPQHLRWKPVRQHCSPLLLLSLSRLGRDIV